MARFATRSVYDRAAAGFDLPPLRFWSVLGQRLVDHARPQPGEHVLDVGCGTGAATFPAARAVGPGGRVDAIDLARAATRQAAARAAALQIDNVRFHCGDLLRHQTASRYDLTLAAFSLFFVADVQAAVRKLETLTRPAGRAAISFWGEDSFSPLARLFHEDVAGATPAGAAPPTPWTRFTSADAIRAVVDGPGRTTRILSECVRFALASPDDWWTVVMHSGFRAFVDPLPETEQVRLRARHLARVRERCASGLDLHLPVHYALVTFGS